MANVKLLLGRWWSQYRYFCALFQCQLMLRHSGGVLLADKSISMSPLFVTMSETCVVAASKQGLYTWMFQKKSGATERYLILNKNKVKPVLKTT